jgi:hypothetical protein
MHNAGQFPIIRFLALLVSLSGGADAQPVASTVIDAKDETRVSRRGEWSETAFRFAAAGHLHTTQDRAALKFSFKGTGIAVRLGAHAVPAYGTPNLGRLAVFIDGHFARMIRPLSTAREVVMAEKLEPGQHQVRCVHRASDEQSGCRIESFRTWSQPRGHLHFRLNGAEEAFLVDARAILTRADKVVRDLLVRNWLTGQCCLSGLPPGDGYRLELRASGWQSVGREKITVTADKPSWQPPIYLQRSPETVMSRFRFPGLNRQAIRRPGETFRARFLGFDATIDHVELSRTVGPARISRRVAFKEDVAAKYYYDREVTVTLPEDMPPGLYDLSVQVTGGRRSGICRSPRSVHVVSAFPRQPVLGTWGHLDTSGQYQAEYLERLAGMITLVGADLVLVSNAVNPAYVSGALARLPIPHVINFGNHQFPGHEAWYGDPVGLIDFGPNICVLNFGHPWHVGTARADRLLKSRPLAMTKIINAFEANAPLEFLDRHRVCMIHDAHGIGTKVANLGKTPTRRIGKTNSTSFRLVRIAENAVVSCTYNGHETAPIPFLRNETPPVQVDYRHPNDGRHAGNTATITNRLKDVFPNGRISLVLPAGDYRVAGGRLESQVTSDNGKLVVLTLRAEIPANGRIDVSAQPK